MMELDSCQIAFPNLIEVTREALAQAKLAYDFSPALTPVRALFENRARSRSRMVWLQFEAKGPPGTPGRWLVLYAGA